MLSEEDRRRDRVGFRVPAHIAVGDDGRRYRGYVVNLSASGALILMEDIAELGEDVRLRFRVDADTECRAEGHVARVTQVTGGQAFGIELTEHNPAYEHFVRNIEHAASTNQLLLFIRDMRRIDVDVADAAAPRRLARGTSDYTDRLPKP